MLKNRMSLMLLTCMATSTMVACGAFPDLREELEELYAERSKTLVHVTKEDSAPGSVVLVYLGSKDGSEVLDYWLMPESGEVEVWLAQREGWLVAYVDANNDLVLQPTESFGWANNGLALNPQESVDASIDIGLRRPNQGESAAPNELLNSSLLTSAQLRYGKRGEIAEIDEERFSERAAKVGLWQPYFAIRGGSNGLFFLEPYDDKKIPVLLIHGIMGYPAQFEPLINAIDKSRYQIWFLNYASGFRLPTIGNTVFQIMAELQHQLEFEQFHIVAHSMGGLVARWYLRECSLKNTCDYVNTFTSLASPFGGVASASLGIKYAPIQIPVWKDLQPGGEFLVRLFDNSLPNSTDHHLLFAFKNVPSLGDIISVESSDGVISLSSQLRPEAQLQASEIRGFDQTHTSILQDTEALNAVIQIIDSN